VLEDLPGQPRGIFVTRNGYQSGAKEWAMAHGILLYELREADYPPALPMVPGGWAQIQLVQMPLEGLITTQDDPTDAQNIISTGFNFEIFSPQFSDLNFTISGKWVQDEFPSLGIEHAKTLDIPSIQPRERLFFDEHGAEVGNLSLVFGEMKRDQSEKKSVTHLFKPPVYIQTGDTLIPRAKVIGVSVSVEIIRTDCLRRARPSTFTQLVLHQLNSNQSWWFGATPQAISKLSKGPKPAGKRPAKRQRKRGGRR
jgi:hypothetical protein